MFWVAPFPAAPGETPSLNLGNGLVVHTSQGQVAFDGKGGAIIGSLVADSACMGFPPGGSLHLRDNGARVTSQEGGFPGMGTSTIQTQVTRSTGWGRWAEYRLTEFRGESQAMAAEVLAGLSQSPKSVPPKYFYDAEGSRLFDQICRLPEYYLTRAETSILEKYAGALPKLFGRGLCLIEFGSGDCRKGRFVLETGAVDTFVPVDISTECLCSAARQVAADYPFVAVHAVAMDFQSDMTSLDALLSGTGRRIILYAGSSIGNLTPPEAHRLLSQFAELLGEGGALLIGYDLKKDAGILQRAYDDAQGVTAAFNLNLLARLNRELKADFDLESYRHVALYDQVLGRIEMHLESLVAQEVTIANQHVQLEAHERIHTENSYKYSVAQFDAMAYAAGFDPSCVWLDPTASFALGAYTTRPRNIAPRRIPAAAKVRLLGNLPF